MIENPLGKTAPIPNRYNPDLLFPIPRIKERAKLPVFANGKVNGLDLWRAYELSWLNEYSRPEVRVAEFTFNSESEYLIESKSLKLYLNSLNGEVFKDEADISARLISDLSSVSGYEVGLTLISLGLINRLKTNIVIGSSLDKNQDFELMEEPDGSMLKVSDSSVTNEQLYSDLFRSVCPITGQPDWATFLIEYSGAKIIESSLLSYICSFRKHAGFHEDCGERIFNDIIERCKPRNLTISLNFVRRGGIDISVFRSTEDSLSNKSLVRLIRQ